MHDPRIGRFFAIDPLSPKYPFYSTYAFSGNRVIDAVELEGLEPKLRIIEPGDTYWGIAKGLKGVSAADLIRWNTIAYDRLHKYVGGAIFLEDPDGWRMANEDPNITFGEALESGIVGGVPVWFDKIHRGFDAFAKFTSGDDVLVLRDGEHTDGSKATSFDVVLAAVFITLPVSGKAVGKSVEYLVGYTRNAESLVAGGKTFEHADDFYDATRGMSVNDRIAAYKQSAKNIADANGWTKNKRLGRLNGRTVYTDKNGLNHSLDTLHGRFEVIDKK